MLRGLARYEHQYKCDRGLGRRHAHEVSGVVASAGRVGCRAAGHGANSNGHLDRRPRLDGRVISAPNIDWPELIAFKRSFTDPVPSKHEDGYRAKGIATFHGPKAQFAGRNSVEVDGETLEARHILIATGATPATLGISGEEHLITNEEFLALETLPERIVMVGGGYIAAEFSHIAARAGRR